MLDNLDALFLVEDRYASVKTELLDLKQEFRDITPVAWILQASNWDSH